VISNVHDDGDDGAVVIGMNALCSVFLPSLIRQRRKLSWLMPSFVQNSRTVWPLSSNREINSCHSSGLRRTLPLDVIFIIPSA